MIVRSINEDVDEEDGYHIDPDDTTSEHRKQHKGDFIVYYQLTLNIILCSISVNFDSFSITFAVSNSRRSKRRAHEKSYPR